MVKRNEYQSLSVDNLRQDRAWQKFVKAYRKRLAFIETTGFVHITVEKKHGTRNA